MGRQGQAMRLLLVLSLAFGNAASLGTCSLPTEAETLMFLSPVSVTEVNATPAECCALCASHGNCSSWSHSGSKWTPATPCHLSPYAILHKLSQPGQDYCGGSAPNAPPAPAPGPKPTPHPSPTTPGVYVIGTSTAARRQVFEGIQVELMSDSIGSYNQGMPGDGKLVPDDDTTTLGAPHDLTPSERTRFATEVLQGTRTIRLAMGLYLRGLSPNNASVIGRWPSQMSELKQLQDLSGIDGWAPEYWSPPPAWKSSDSYYTGTLKSFNESFLDSFSDGVITDIKYLQDAGLRIKWWGLQNEPGSGNQNITTKCTRDNTTLASATAEPGNKTIPGTYSQCHYSACGYYFAFTACAKKIRKLDPTIRIHANSQNGQAGSSPIANDPETLPLVDAFTWRLVNRASAAAFNNTPYNYGKLDFTNEMEYQPGSPYAGTQVGTVSNVNIFLNTLVFKNSPTGVVMLHAIKPTTNLESLGYGWTWWRSTGDNSTSPDFPELKPNHFTYNWWNWNAVAPFVKTVPWNSIRLNVQEDNMRMQQRVVAFETPAAGLGGPLHQHTKAGKVIVVLTNEHDGPFTTTVATADSTPRTWIGYSFQGSSNSSTFNISLGKQTTAGLKQGFATQLAPYTVQWW